ncbi:ribosomal RNA processing protein 36-like isoform X2 [Sigmodon hispidus]
MPKARAEAGAQGSRGARKSRSMAGDKQKGERAAGGQVGRGARHLPAGTEGQPEQRSSMRAEREYFRRSDFEGTDTSDMSFEELLELQSQGGHKANKQLLAGRSTQKQSPRQPVCVADKHRPLEMSAKVQVPFLRQVVPISKKVARDPRFDDLSGEYNPEIFDKTYQFLNDIRAKEKALVKKQLRRYRSGEGHEKLQQLLRRMEQQEMAQQERKQQQELRLTLKQERRALAQQGHRPYFLKKSEERQLILAEKFKELKRSKKLESFLSRKRRRNAGKDRKHLPLSSAQ